MLDEAGVALAPAPRRRAAPRSPSARRARRRARRRGARPSSRSVARAGAEGARSRAPRAALPTGGTSSCARRARGSRTAGRRRGTARRAARRRRPRRDCGRRARSCSRPTRRRPDRPSSRPAGAPRRGVRPRRSRSGVSTASSRRCQRARKSARSSSWMRSMSAFARGARAPADRRGSAAAVPRGRSLRSRRGAASPPSTTRAFAVQMRPPGGSTTRGYSAAREPAVPAARPVGPRRGQPAVVPEAARDAAGDRPADPARGVADDEVLVRDARDRRDGQRLVDVRRSFEADERRVEAPVPQRDPGERAAAPRVILVDHGSPDRLQRVEPHVVRARDVDDLGRVLEPSRSPAESGRPRGRGRRARARRGRPSRPRCS